MTQLTRRDILTAGLTGLASLTTLQTFAQTFKKETPESIPLEVLAEDYKPEILAENLRQLGELAFDVRGNNLFFVQRTPNCREEGVYEIEDEKPRFRFSCAGDPEGLLHKTQIAANEKGEIAIYSSSIDNEILKIHSTNTGRELFRIEQPFNEKGLRLNSVLDIRAQERDFYIVANSGYVEVLDREKQELKRTDYMPHPQICFREGLMFGADSMDLSNPNFPVNVKNPYKNHIYVDSGTRRSAMFVQPPYKTVEEDDFFLHHLSVDRGTQNLLIAGKMSKRQRGILGDHSYLLGIKVRTRGDKPVYPIARITNPEISITGVDSDPAGNIYLGLSLINLVGSDRGFIYRLKPKKSA
jgi:hypothetical protein